MVQAFSFSFCPSCPKMKKKTKMMTMRMKSLMNLTVYFYSFFISWWDGFLNLIDFFCLIFCPFFIRSRLDFEFQLLLLMLRQIHVAATQYLHQPFASLPFFGSFPSLKQTDFDISCSAICPDNNYVRSLPTSLSTTSSIPDDSSHIRCRLSSFCAHWAGSSSNL